MAENDKSKGKKQVPLRLSASLYNDLSRWAEEEFRSLNGQIEFLLSECVKKHKKSSPKKKYDDDGVPMELKEPFTFTHPDGTKERFENVFVFFDQLMEQINADTDKVSENEKVKKEE